LGHNEGLNVVLFPGAHSNLGDSFCTQVQIACKFGAGTKDGRLRSVIEMQAQTIDSNT